MVLLWQYLIWIVLKQLSNFISLQMLTIRITLDNYAHCLAAEIQKDSYLDYY
jgi:hypothetical protein